MTNEKIFISYRRTDASGFAGRLFDRLSARFGEENIFMDVDTIDPGVDFVDVLERAVSTCNLVIALVGRGWLNAEDDKGKRRLDDPGDFVRIEIATALNRDIRMIPVLVQGARMPASRELPDTLKRLARLNAFELRHERFNTDADRLAQSIEAYFIKDAERREREAAEKVAREQAERERLEREAAELAAREKAEREQRARELEIQQRRIAEYLAEAQAGLDREDWQTAHRNYRQILELRPDHIQAQVGYQTASDHLELASLYGEAILQRGDGHLARALETLRQIQGKDANYRDVPEMILAIEKLLGEQANQAAPGIRKSFLDRLSDLPRGLWYLGGITGLILMIVVAVWGGGNLLGSLSSIESPALTGTELAAVVMTGTETPESAAETDEQLPTKTLTKTLTTTEAIPFFPAELTAYEEGVNWVSWPNSETELTDLGTIYLQLNDGVRTDHTGRAELLFPDLFQVDVFGLTEIFYTEGRYETDGSFFVELQIVDGHIWVQMDEKTAGKVRVTIDADRFIETLEPGTEFSIMEIPDFDAFDLVVQEGAVECSYQGEKRIFRKGDAGGC